MTKTERLLKLFRAISDQDWTAAREIALSVCNDEENMGHRQVARRLRSALNPNGRVNSAGTGMARLVANLPELAALARIEPLCGLAEVQLRKRSRDELLNVISEWKNRDKLALRGLRPRNRLFFHGPPGCGKSITATALGLELQLPTYLIRFDAVIGAYLGQTAIHLRQLFDFAERTPAVMVFDELDALGKRRGNPLDVGELDRIVIALMQELEHANPLGLIVATSNLPKHIDDALWRRFDLTIEFPKPNRSELNRYAHRVCTEFEQKLTPSLMRQIEAMKSFADARNLLVAEARRITLKAV